MDTYNKKHSQIISIMYGEEQINLMIEEMAELTQALCKYKRMQSDNKPRATETDILENIIEEIADVEIMLEQIKYQLKINEQILNAIEKMKILRTMELWEEQNNEN